MIKSLFSYASQIYYYSSPLILSYLFILVNVQVIPKLSSNQLPLAIITLFMGIISNLEFINRVVNKGHKNVR